MDKSKKLTVFMTVYNRKDYIKQAIEGVLSQTYKDFDFIILNNASNDGTTDIINCFSDSRIRHVIREENIGGIANGNSAFDIVESEYFIITHDDDIMLPDFLKTEIEFLELNPDYDLVDTGITLIDKCNKEYYFEQNNNNGLRFEKEDFIAAYLQKNKMLSCPTVMFRTSFFKKHNLTFNSSVRGYCDQFLYCQASLIGAKIFCISQKLYLYRVHADQDTFNVNFDDRIKMLDTLYQLLQEHNYANLKEVFNRQSTFYINGIVNAKVHDEISAIKYTEFKKLIFSKVYFSKVDNRTKLAMFLCEKTGKLGKSIIKRFMERKTNVFKEIIAANKQE